jgi:selenide, water dikinase
MGPGDLAHVLRHLKTTAGGGPAELLVGLNVADDAAVWKLDAERALVQTVDFFTPIVDDPYTYGAIAAANALSDVYAMGGEPFMALAIAGFPEDLPRELLAEIFRGGAEKAAEAGVVVAGGHTVTDEEPKYGLSVTGMVHPDRVLTKAAARAGDVAFLTKPIGTGVITTAIKREKASEAHVQEAVSWMLRLNRDAARVLNGLQYVKACTDITGFGLLGHGYEVAVASGVCLDIESERVPSIAGAMEYAAAGISPGGAERNRAYLEEHAADGKPRVTLDPSIPEERLTLLFDPQTSGGLFFAAPADHAEAVRAAFEAARQPLWRVGRFVEGSAVKVR